jgi:MFS family permease
MSTVGMAVLAASNGLGLYLISLVVLGFGSGLLHVAPGAIVGDTVTALPAAASAPVTAEDGASPARPGRGGTVVAAFQMTGDLGSVLGPLVAGRLADGAGFGAAFGVTAGVIGLALCFAVFAPETRRAGPRTVAA